MRHVHWTLRARSDLAQIRDYIAQDSPNIARLVVQRLVAAAERLGPFPQSGRVVPELPERDLREVLHPPYRIVYRLVNDSEVHVLTVHHSARRLPEL